MNPKTEFLTPAMYSEDKNPFQGQSGEWGAAFFLWSLYLPLLFTFTLSKLLLLERKGYLCFVTHFYTYAFVCGSPVTELQSWVIH